MKARVIKNYDLKREIEVFGIAFQVKIGSQYCKYPIGMQSFTTRKQAKEKLSEVQEKLNTLTESQIEFINSHPINKHQYVKL